MTFNLLKALEKKWELKPKLKPEHPIPLSIDDYTALNMEDLFINSRKRMKVLSRAYLFLEPRKNKATRTGYAKKKSILSSYQVKIEGKLHYRDSETGLKHKYKRNKFKQGMSHLTW